MATIMSNGQVYQLIASRFVAVAYYGKSAEFIYSDEFAKWHSGQMQNDEKYPVYVFTTVSAFTDLVHVTNELEASELPINAKTFKHAMVAHLLDDK